jgi:hypothetical protein
LSLCLPPILVALPLFLDRGTVLRTGENRGKEIGVITLFTHLRFTRTYWELRIAWDNKLTIYKNILGAADYIGQQAYNLQEHTGNYGLYGTIRALASPSISTTRLGCNTILDLGNQFPDLDFIADIY